MRPDYCSAALHNKTKRPILDVLTPANAGNLGREPPFLKRAAPIAEPFHRPFRKTPAFQA
jgi:hypothetical protein